MKKSYVIVIWLFGIYSQLYTANYLLNGGQTSQINYRMDQEVIPSSGIQKLLLSYVIPKDFSSPSYNQKITKFDIQFSKQPDSRSQETDIRGNDILKVTWYNPSETIHASLIFKVMNTTKLEPIDTNAPFPLTSLPSDVKPYLLPTEQVPSTHQQIVRKAKQITASAKTEFDAVQQILTWIVDYMNYVLNPKDYGAIWAIQTGKGNCQNYSHLAATFMRAVGIPVRILNGITLKEPYNVRLGNGLLTMRMAEGRHSWIEVYFPDLGWVPFDPQQMQLFVSNRFIRVEVGLDNNEAVSDGCVRWTRSKGSKGTPRFKESIDARFIEDDVRLLAEKQNYGPRKMLLTPPVETFFTEVFSQEAAPPSVICI